MITRKQALTYICIFSLIAAIMGAALAILALRGVFPGYSLTQSSQRALPLERLNTLADVIEAKFVAPVDREALMVNAQRGMVAGLGDKYSAFYTQEEYQKLAEQRSGEYQGIGIMLSQRAKDGALEVFDVYSGTPADKAGIKPHDVLLMIDGHDTAGMDVEAAAALVRAGTDEGVKLSVLREEVILEFTVIAEKVTVPQVEWRMIDDHGRKVGYIKIKQFMGDVVEGFDKAVGELQKAGMQALVIDLRNNPGGDLQMVVEITDKLLPQGVILTERARSGEEKVFRSNAEQLKLPMSVIVNSYSASASEIMAGAIKDHGVGSIVGVRTYGKGVVQTVFPLASGDYVKLTTAIYLTPNGNNLHGVGIEPDVEADIPEALKSTPLGELSESQDTQLQAALSALQIR